MVETSNSETNSSEVNLMESKNAVSQRRKELYDFEDFTGVAHAIVCAIHILAYAKSFHFVMGCTALVLTRSNFYASGVNAHLMAGEYTSLYYLYDGSNQSTLKLLKQKERSLDTDKRPPWFNIYQKL